ncbi:hypothetical protein RF11_05221 [Thelohanellus kitauei]|uniref:Uncharacterized protein n=1 Tax=Thelohanellus kitauei TaxID=669202 RepID=A0A0C2ME29_THEKT|nr:hypothetical protein RF11_05221 [Thelohanellus kitauei]
MKHFLIENGFIKRESLLAYITPDTEEKHQWREIREGIHANVDRNHAEFIKKQDRSYKTGEVRLFNVEKTNAETFCPLLERTYKADGTTRWSNSQVRGSSNKILFHLHKLPVRVLSVVQTES